MPVLYIGNKNYSSWSLRPWLLMKELGIPFEERLLRFGDEAAWAPFRKAGGSARVPALVDGDLRVWDSLAITEYLAEQYPGVWPTDRAARAWARCAAAEMHSGFSALRRECSMSIGVRVRLHRRSEALEHDIARVNTLFCEGLSRHGGPLLGGAVFTAVDAFYAPVCFRVETYALELSAPAMDYVSRILARPFVQDWAEAGLAESFRDESHELEIQAAGEWLADLRSQPA